jgi:pimeloyl-ACP methyl ester carboxylesterase
VNGQCCSNGVCSAPTVELRTWDDRPNPIDIFVRVGAVPYKGSHLRANVTPTGGTFEWRVSAPSVLRLVSNTSDPDARFEGVTPGTSSICLHYTAPDQQTADQCTFVIVKYPFVFVHGFNSSAAAWDPLASELTALGLIQGVPGCAGQRAGFDHSDVDFCAVDYSITPVWGSFSDPETIARSNLSQAIRNVKDATGASKVVILAHSMGGLVSRVYIEMLGGTDVERLITIGTPNAGTALADLISDPDVKAVDSLWLPTMAIRQIVQPDSPAIAAMRTDSSRIGPLTGVKNENAASATPGTERTASRTR